MTDPQSAYVEPFTASHTLDDLHTFVQRYPRLFVLTGAGGIVEIQGTAEGAPFSEEEFKALLDLARSGIGR